MKAKIATIFLIVLFFVFAPFTLRAMQRTCSAEGTGSGGNQVHLTCETDKYPFKINAIRIYLQGIPYSPNWVTITLIRPNYRQKIYLHHVPSQKFYDEGDPNEDADAGVIYDASKNEMFVNVNPKGLYLLKGDSLEVISENIGDSDWNVVVYYEILSE